MKFLCPNACCTNEVHQSSMFRAVRPHSCLARPLNHKVTMFLKSQSNGSSQTDHGNLCMLLLCEHHIHNIRSAEFLASVSQNPSTIQTLSLWNNCWSGLMMANGARGDPTLLAHFSFSGPIDTSYRALLIFQACR